MWERFKNSLKGLYGKIAKKEIATILILLFIAITSIALYCISVINGICVVVICVLIALMFKFRKNTKRFVILGFLILAAILFNFGYNSGNFQKNPNTPSTETVQVVDDSEKIKQLQSELARKDEEIASLKEQIAKHVCEKCECCDYCEKCHKCADCCTCDKSKPDNSGKGGESSKTTNPTPDSTPDPTQPSTQPPTTPPTTDPTPTVPPTVPPTKEEVTGIKGEPSKKTIKVGEELEITYEVLGNGKNKNVKITNSNSEVVKIIGTEKGKVNVKGLEKGTATVTFTTEEGGYTFTCEITVVKDKIDVKSLKVTDEIVLYKGESEYIDYEIKPSNATDKDVDFSGYDSKIIKVSSKGKVTGKEVGETKVKVSVDGKHEYCKVIVKEKTVIVDPKIVLPTSITINPTSKSMNINESFGLTTTILPENATDKSVTYVSKDKNVAEVDQSGKVTAKGKGTTTIEVSCVADSKISASCSVTVIAAGDTVVLPTSITINPTSKSMNINESFGLTTTILPENATDKSVTYVSKDKNVAEVDQSGKVTAKGQGTTTIDVYSNASNKISASCLITVAAPGNTGDNNNVPTIGGNVKEVQMYPSNVTLQVGDSKTLDVVVLPADAKNQTVQYIGFDSSIISVDLSGKVTAIKPGTTTVTVKTNDGGFTDTSVITVVPAQTQDVTKLTPQVTFFEQIGNEIKGVVKFSAARPNAKITSNLGISSSSIDGGMAYSFTIQLPENLNGVAAVGVEGEGIVTIEETTNYNTIVPQSAAATDVSNTATATTDTTNTATATTDTTNANSAATATTNTTNTVTAATDTTNTNSTVTKTTDVTNTVNAVTKTNDTTSSADATNNTVNSTVNNNTVTASDNVVVTNTVNTVTTSAQVGVAK